MGNSLNFNSSSIFIGQSVNSLSLLEFHGVLVPSIDLNGSFKFLQQSTNILIRDSAIVIGISSKLNFVFVRAVFLFTDDNTSIVNQAGLGSSPDKSVRVLMDHIKISTSGGPPELVPAGLASSSIAVCRREEVAGGVGVEFDLGYKGGVGIEAMENKGEVGVKFAFANANAFRVFCFVMFLSEDREETEGFIDGSLDEESESA